MEALLRKNGLSPFYTKQESWEVPDPSMDVEYVYIHIHRTWQSVCYKYVLKDQKINIWIPSMLLK